MSDIYGWRILTAASREAPWKILDEPHAEDSTTVRKAFYIGEKLLCTLMIRETGEVLVRTVVWVQVNSNNKLIIVSPPG